MGKATATSKTKLTQSDADDLAELAALKEASRLAVRAAVSNQLTHVTSGQRVFPRSKKSTLPLKFGPSNCSI